jgi:hypothetical protein
VASKYNLRKGEQLRSRRIERVTSLPLPSPKSLPPDECLCQLSGAGIKNAPLDESRASLGYELVAGAASTASAAARATTSVPATTATRAVVARTSQVYFELTIAQLAPVEHAGGFFGISLRLHFDKAETFGAACLAVCDDRCGHDFARFSKKLPQFIFCRLVRQIAYI